MFESSDQEGYSANDETKPEEKLQKRRKKRCRELERIRIDDDDDDDDDSEDEAARRKPPKLGSPDPLGAREPRSCVLKANQKRKPLSRLLEELLRTLEKKDPDNFFAWPVNDNFAPNYSNIIRRPMDFCTMKQKIDNNEYRSLNFFINDFKLICNNAMKYNKPGTVYHKAAKKLLHVGLKQLTPAKLRPLGSILGYMYDIPIRELGFDMGKMDVKALNKSNTRSSMKHDDDPPSDSASDSKPEPLNLEDELKLKREAARELHRKRLARKAFPRMNSEGKTTLCLIVENSEARLPPNERPMTLGNYIGKLTHGTGSLQTFREDRRNLIKGVKPLNYGPFSSYAPYYDSTFATLTKEESHLLFHGFPTETGACNAEMLRFAEDSPWSAIYDMEKLFPAANSNKEPENDTNASVASADELQHQDLSRVKVDVEQLKTLSELGIDMDFLSEMEEDIVASQQDYGLNNALKHTLTILRRLEAQQRARLSAPVPAHLSLVPKATPSERELARAALSCLRGMAVRVAPKHIAPLSSVRKAMGITLDHLDTPMSVEEFIEFEMTENSKDSCNMSDQGSRSDMDIK